MMCELGERLMNVSDRVLEGRHSETGSASQDKAVRLIRTGFSGGPNNNITIK